MFPFFGFCVFLIYHPLPLCDVISSFTMYYSCESNGKGKFISRENVYFLAGLKPIEI